MCLAITIGSVAFKYNETALVLICRSIRLICAVSFRDESRSFPLV